MIIAIVLIVSSSHNIAWCMARPAVCLRRYTMWYKSEIIPEIGAKPFGGYGGVLFVLWGYGL